MAEMSGEAGPVCVTPVTRPRNVAAEHVAGPGPVTGCSGGGRGRGVTTERGPGAYVTLGYEIRRTELGGSRLVTATARL